jgi:tagatose-1,6-bisphosphate aldolase
MGKFIDNIKRSITSKQEILETLLSTVDSITIDEKMNLVHIKTAKNIAIENDGHMVMINKGMNVQLATQIHLNPKIDFKDKNMGELEDRLQVALEEEEKELKKKRQEFLEQHNKDCESSDCHSK